MFNIIRIDWDQRFTFEVFMKKFELYGSSNHEESRLYSIELVLMELPGKKKYSLGRFYNEAKKEISFPLIFSGKVTVRPPPPPPPLPPLEKKHSHWKITL